MAFTVELKVRLAKAEAQLEALNEVPELKRKRAEELRKSGKKGPTWLRPLSGAWWT